MSEPEAELAWTGQEQWRGAKGTDLREVWEVDSVGRGDRLRRSWMRTSSGAAGKEEQTRQKCVWKLFATVE